jgi:hypothetical protein
VSTRAWPLTSCAQVASACNTHVVPSLQLCRRNHRSSIHSTVRQHRSVTHGDGARGGKHAHSEGVHRRRHSNSVLSVAAGSSQNYATKPDAKAESIRATCALRLENGAARSVHSPPTSRRPLGPHTAPCCRHPSAGGLRFVDAQDFSDFPPKISSDVQNFYGQTVSRFYNRSPGLPCFRTLCTLAATMAVPAAILLMLADDYGFNNVRSIFL